MTEEEKQKANHEIRLSKREVFWADGVLYVENFDDTSLSLSTVMGELILEGQNLKIEGFSKENGTVRIVGTVQAIYYSDDSRTKKKLFGRLFQ